jgi:apolipoprotein N-acyltransferase
MSDLKAVSAVDPYAPKLTLWQKHPQWGWVLATFALTVVLTCAAFPPYNMGEAGYVFAVPFLLWAYRRPPFKIFAWTVLAAQAVAWTILLGWLHHVTWVGLFLLGPFVGVIIGAWYLAAWWTIPRTTGHLSIVRVFILLGLAAGWVLLEWVRSTLFGGFPWLPLAASQWQRPLILQSASYAGAWSVSFILAFFNLGAAAYAHRIFFEGATGLRKRSQEFSIALILLMAGAFPFLSDFLHQQSGRLARISIVQPYIPQEEKWDRQHTVDVLRTIEKVTWATTRKGDPDFVMWPEAVVPSTLNYDPNVALWLNSVSRTIGKPILLGAAYTEGADGPAQSWYNGATVVDPKTGVSSALYAKRKLVPFGEYIPLRPIFGWLDKVVPIGGDFQRGTDATPLVVSFGTKQLSAGVLICYEDVFSDLARDSARSGADFLAVLTNNAWYGEGGAAYQHATHSVLRAVETRRPVIRCGNDGWSGWIDEYGNTRVTLKNDNDSIYFRGGQTITVTRDLRWRGRQSFYTEHGDWFLIVCVLLAVGGYYTALILRPAPLRTSGKAPF